MIWFLLNFQTIVLFYALPVKFDLGSPELLTDFYFQSILDMTTLTYVCRIADFMNSKPDALNRRAPTIIDVARTAGVSPKTVSRVINGNDYVSLQTRERVESAIVHLNFRMNRAARSLVSNRSAIIGLAIPDVSNPYYAEVVSGVEQVAHEHDYSVLLFNTNNNCAREANALQILEEHRADGIIYNTPAISEDELRFRLQRQRAAVLIGHDGIGDLAGIVNIDTYEAAVKAVEHLVGVGRRKIAYLRFAQPTYPHRERLRGVIDGLQACGLTLRPEYTVDCTGNLHANFELVRALLSAHSEIDAIIGYHDLLAFTAMEACDASGINIPDDVAVIGFDDIVFASLHRISLTTFRIPRFEVGVSAAQMLFGRIAGQTDPAQIMLKTTLIQRESTPHGAAQ